MENTNNKDQRLPLEWYKENVNLVEFASEMYGFEVNYKHTPKFNSREPNWITMENENGENFIFSRNFQNSTEGGVSHFYYKNTTGNSHEPVFGNNRYDRGSIFDFIMFRDGIELGKAIGKIKKFLSEVKPKIENDAKYNLKPSKRIPLGDELMPYYGIKPINKQSPEEGVLNFLYLRDIPKEVLTNKNFANHIYFRSYENHFGYLNTDLCFPITSPSEKNFVGFFAVNQYKADQSSFKQILGFKNDGLWFSGFDKTKPLENFIIMESPLDAISHYYLNPDLEGKNVLYAATIGSIAASQVKTIDLLLDTYKPLKVTTACDRDIEGQKFNLFISSQSSHKKEEHEKYQVFFQSNKHHVGEMILNFNSKNPQENDLFTSNVKTFFENANEKLTQGDIEKKAFNVHIEKFSDEVVSVKSDFHSTAGNWNALTRLIMETKFDNKIKWGVDLPVNKDFNLDLQMAESAYLAEEQELKSQDKINKLPSLKEFLKENYKMDGIENKIFLERSKTNDLQGKFLVYDNEKINQKSEQTEDKKNNYLER